MERKTNYFKSSSTQWQCYIYSYFSYWLLETQYQFLESHVDFDRNCIKSIHYNPLWEYCILFHFFIPFVVSKRFVIISLIILLFLKCIIIFALVSSYFFHFLWLNVFSYSPSWLSLPETNDAVPHTVLTCWRGRYPESYFGFTLAQLLQRLLVCKAWLGEDWAVEAGTGVRKCRQHFEHGCASQGALLLCVDKCSIRTEKWRACNQMGDTHYHCVV